MSMQLIESYASQALSCSQQMYRLAEQADWEELGKLEQERALLLDTLFRHPGLSLWLARIAGTLRQIIEVDQQTMALGKQAREALKSEMKLLNQGKRAVDAYLGNIA